MARARTPAHNVNLYLDPEPLAHLDAMAERLSLTRSQTVARLIERVWGIDPANPDRVIPRGEAPVKPAVVKPGKHDSVEPRFKKS